MKQNQRLCIIAFVVACLLRGTAQAQDVSGLSAGVFYEHRTDNKIATDELVLSYYGFRIQVRDERFIEAFVDLGVQGLGLGSYKAEEEGCFGLGGTLWLLRADDALLPLDIGAYGSYHTASYTLAIPDGRETDAKYGWYLAQIAMRYEVRGGTQPYVRAGVMASKIDPDDSTFLSDEDLDVVNPAVNVGIQFTLEPKLAITVEGNYSEGVGGSVRVDYWF